MRDRFRLQIPEPAAAPSTRRDEPPLAPAVRLLVQRWRVEAALRHLGFMLRVRGNRIAILFDTQVTVLELALDPDGGLALSIRAFLGEVILVAPARAFAEGRNEEAGPARIEIDEAGAVSVAWQHTFPDEVDGDLVTNGLSEVCDLAESIHATLVEDFYLKGVNCP